MYSFWLAVQFKFCRKHFPKHDFVYGASRPKAMAPVMDASVTYSMEAGCVARLSGQNRSCLCRTRRRAMRSAWWAALFTCASCSAQWTALARLLPAPPVARRGCSSL